LKALLLAVTAVAALGLTACGDKAAAPLGLDQRIPSAQDAPDSKADPVEKRETVNGPDEFISRLGDRFINPTPKDVSDFKSAGFERAIHDTRFIPEEPGGPHTRTAPHIFSLVMQFESADGAQKALDILHTDSIRPCPENCATQVSEFDADDISDSHGTRRYATAASVKATGDKELHPYDSYEIEFADGPFAYRVILSGSPGKVSQDEAEQIAKSLYDRVKGAPAED
jgi:hypothetical protein